MYGDGTLDPKLIPKARSVLHKLKEDCQAESKPATDEQILKVLYLVASVLLVDLPDDDGLLLYVSLLQEIPERILQDAAREVLSNHIYRTMPAPAVFIQSAANQRFQRDSKVMATKLAIAQRRLTKIEIKQINKGEDDDR